MGNLQELPYFHTFNKSDFTIISSGCRKNSIVQFKDSTTAISQLLSNPSKQLIQSFLFRAINKEYLVNVLGTVKNESTQFCFAVPNTSNSQIQVLIQNIQYRLSDLGIIKFSEGLYILSQCFRGFKSIYDKYGKFTTQIEEQQIGINEKGQCKVWASQNFYQGILYSGEGQYLLECEMVQKIFALVETRMQISMEKQQKQTYKKKKDGFVQDLKILGKQADFFSAISFTEDLCKIYGNKMGKMLIKMPTFQTENPQELQLDLPIISNLRSSLSTYRKNNKGKISLKRSSEEKDKITHSRKSTRDYRTRRQEHDSAKNVNMWKFFTANYGNIKRPGQDSIKQSIKIMQRSMKVDHRERICWS